MESTDALVMQHQDYVKSLARGISKKLPRNVDFDDLVSLGQMGLITAAKQYEPGRGVAFTTFAYYRIRGSIFDGLRQMSGMPPPVRREASRLAGENETAEMAAEAAEASDDPEFLAKQLTTAIGRLGAIFLISKSSEDGGELEAADTVTPSDELEAKESVELVRQALLQLTEEHRELIRLLYFEHRSMTDVATEMKKNKSTISRRHAEAIDALKAILAPDSEPARPRAPSGPVAPLSPHMGMLRPNGT